jgi:hypothetical protein
VIRRPVFSTDVSEWDANRCDTRSRCGIPDSGL